MNLPCTLQLSTESRDQNLFQSAKWCWKVDSECWHSLNATAQCSLQDPQCTTPTKTYISPFISALDSPLHTAFSVSRITALKKYHGYGDSKTVYTLSVQTAFISGQQNVYERVASCSTFVLPVKLSWPYSISSPFTLKPPHTESNHLSIKVSPVYFD